MGIGMIKGGGVGESFALREGKKKTQKKQRL